MDGVSAVLFTFPVVWMKTKLFKKQFSKLALSFNSLALAVCISALHKSTNLVKT